MSIEIYRSDYGRVRLRVHENLNIVLVKAAFGPDMMYLRSGIIGEKFFIKNASKRLIPIIKAQKTKAENGR